MIIAVVVAIGDPVLEPVHGNGDAERDMPSLAPAPAPAPPGCAIRACSLVLSSSFLFFPFFFFFKYIFQIVCIDLSDSPQNRKLDSLSVMTIFFSEHVSLQASCGIVLWDNIHSVVSLVSTPVAPSPSFSLVRVSLSIRLVCPTPLDRFADWFAKEDVRRLGQMHFLRLHGARNIGIRTSFGVPVVSRWGVTFVIVFYSRTAVQVGGFAACVHARKGFTPCLLSFGGRRASRKHLFCRPRRLRSMLDSYRLELECWVGASPSGRHRSRRKNSEVLTSGHPLMGILTFGMRGLHS